MKIAIAKSRYCNDVYLDIVIDKTRHLRINKSPDYSLLVRLYLASIDVGFTDFDRRYYYKWKWGPNT